jgi:hypothetical protein
MHVINLKCDKKTYKIDVTGKTDEQIELLKSKHFKKGINFCKVV